MPLDKNNSLIMGERLKMLREEEGLSHEALKNKIFEDYGVEISVDSLKIYEVSKVPHAKAYKNEGMRVEYLRIFSDLYKVSTDYLLGLTDIRTPDLNIQIATKLTGLSEASVKILSTLKQVGFDVFSTLDMLISDYRYQNVDSDSKQGHRPILMLLRYFFAYSNTGIKKEIRTDGTIHECNKRGYISSDSIELNDTILENAVIDEIRLALFSLKKSRQDSQASKKEQ